MILPIKLDDLLNLTREKLELLNVALSFIKNTPANEKVGGLYFDGLKKRFEDLFIISSNMLIAALAKEGIETVSPRGAIQEAVKIGWINNTDFWLIAIDARSSSMGGDIHMTTHEFINIASQFSTEIEVLINLIVELK